MSTIGPDASSRLGDKYGTLKSQLHGRSDGAQVEMAEIIYPAGGPG